MSRLIFFLICSFTYLCAFSKPYFMSDTVRISRKVFYTVQEGNGCLVKFSKGKADTVFRYPGSICNIEKQKDAILISASYPYLINFLNLYLYRDKFSASCFSDVFTLNNDEASVVKKLKDVYPVPNTVSEIIIEMKYVECVRGRERQTAKYKCKDGNFVLEKVESADVSFMSDNSLYRLPNTKKGDDVHTLLDALCVTDGMVKSLAEIGIDEKDIRVFKERFLKNARNTYSDEYKIVSDIYSKVNVDELCSYADSLPTISADFINLAMRDIYIMFPRKSVSVDFVFSDGERLQLSYSGRENGYMDSPFNVSYKALRYVAKSFDFYKKLHEVTNGCLLSDDERLDKKHIANKGFAEQYTV